MPRALLLGGLLALLAVAPAWPQTANRPVPAKTAGPLAAARSTVGDPAAGRIKAEDERCQECHGHDGNAQDIEDGVGNIGKFPRLAGQWPAYLLKQLRDFRSGARHNDSMLIMARSLAERDALDIAAYFASQKTAREAEAHNPAGRQLYLSGDAQRGIPACAGCHGEAGEGRQVGDAVFPRLAGQHRRYVVKQLSEWRAGERRNSEGGVMNAIAGALSDTDIEQLAAHVAGL